MLMGDSTGETERIAEIFREIIALSKTGRRNKPDQESTTEVEAIKTDKSQTENHGSHVEQASDTD